MRCRPGPPRPSPANALGLPRILREKLETWPLLINTHPAGKARAQLVRLGAGPSPSRLTDMTDDDIPVSSRNHDASAASNTKMPVS